MWGHIPEWVKAVCRSRYQVARMIPASDRMRVYLEGQVVKQGCVLEVVN